MSGSILQDPAGRNRRRRGGPDGTDLPPFEQVVADHGAAVLRVCRAVVGPQDAEDAWSETFLAAFAAYPRLRPDSNIRAWLVTIAQRKAIDRLRVHKPSLLPPGAVAPSAATDSEPAQTDPALWRALAALPPRQRTAVLYHHVADLPYAQVARLLNTSEAAARRAAADGIAKLRHTLGREGRP